MTPTIDRIQRVMVWRDKQRLTWKWIGKMLGVPAGAAERIYRSGLELMAITGARIGDIEGGVKRWLEANYGAFGKIPDARKTAHIRAAKVRRVAKKLGLGVFRLNGRLYLRWKESEQDLTQQDLSEPKLTQMDLYESNSSDDARRFAVVGAGEGDCGVGGGLQ